MRERIQKILVGTDFSEHSERALLAAANFAAQAGAELEVVHAVELPVMPPVDPFVTVSGTQFMMQRIEAGAGEQMAALQEMVDRLIGERVPVRMHSYQGPPGDSLCMAAKDLDVDLIIIGSHGRGMVMSALLGSVSKYLCEHSDLPVLVIPAPKAAEKKKD